MLSHFFFFFLFCCWQRAETKDRMEKSIYILLNSATIELMSGVLYYVFLRIDEIVAVGKRIIIIYSTMEIHDG